MKQRLNILIAEDDIPSQKLLIAGLKPICNKYYLVNNGIEAVRVFEKHEDIDLVLMDVRMPGMDGYEALRQIRAMCKKVIIIMQTVCAQTEDYRFSNELGCDYHLSKPINLNQLKGIIEDA